MGGDGLKYDKYGIDIGKFAMGYIIYIPFCPITFRISVVIYPCEVVMQIIACGRVCQMLSWWTKN